MAECGGDRQISGEGKKAKKRKTVARRKVVTAVLSELAFMKGCFEQASQCSASQPQPAWESQRDFVLISKFQVSWSGRGQVLPLWDPRGDAQHWSSIAVESLREWKKIRVQPLRF